MLAPASLVHYYYYATYGSYIVPKGPCTLCYYVISKSCGHLLYVQKPVQIIMHNYVLCYINQKGVHIFLFYINFVLHKLAE